MLLTKLNNTLKKYPFFTFVLACFLIIFIGNISQFETIEGKRNRKRFKKLKKKKLMKAVSKEEDPMKKPSEEEDPMKKLRKKINRHYKLIKNMHPELQYNE